MTEIEPKKLDIRFIDNKYYNMNGKTPKIPLSEKYGKRLYNAQKKYGDITIAEARGHDYLGEKAESYRNFFMGKEIEKSAIKLNDINIKTKIKKLNKEQKKNLRTRFRFGFRIFDEKGDSIDSYSGSLAQDGLINFNYYADKIPLACYEDNAHGGFSYVVYDKGTKEVVYNIEYDTEEIER